MTELRYHLRAEPLSGPPTRHAVVAGPRFYSSDIHEPPHMHVIRAENEARVWLDPVVLEYNHGYSRSEVNRILKLTKIHRQKLLEVWNGHFNQ